MLCAPSRQSSCPFKVAGAQAAGNELLRCVLHSPVSLLVRLTHGGETVLLDTRLAPLASGGHRWAAQSQKKLPELRRLELAPEQFKVAGVQAKKNLVSMQLLF